MKKNVVVALLNRISEETETDLENLVNIGAELMSEFKGEDESDLREALSQALLEYYGLAAPAKNHSKDIRFYDLQGHEDGTILTEDALIREMVKDKDSLLYGWNEEEARMTLRDNVARNGSYEGWYEVMVE